MKTISIRELHLKTDEWVYTNDRHMLKAARHFHLTAVNVIGESG